MRRQLDDDAMSAESDTMSDAALNAPLTGDDDRLLLQSDQQQQYAADQNRWVKGVQVGIGRVGQQCRTCSV